MEKSNNNEKLTKVGINWYPRTHGEDKKRDYRRFKIN